MKLYINNIREREITIIEIEPSYTVEALKAMIQNKTEIAPHEQRLLFKGKQLEDMRQLSEYNIQDESTIHLMLRGTGGFCYVKYGDRKYRISSFCSCCSNTLYLKEQVMGRTGIEPSNQELIVDGKIMEDNQSLDYYGISSGKIVELKVKK